MTAWICTHEGCTEPAQARVASDCSEGWRIVRFLQPPAIPDDDQEDE